MESLEDLTVKYPRLFKDSNFSFQCKDGWFDLLDCLLYFINRTLGRFREIVETKQEILDKGGTPLPWIAEYFEKNPVDPLVSFKIFQCKEKFGGLRFYWGCDVSNSETKEVWGAVAFAESLSFRICEDCGQKSEGTRASPGQFWIRTLCLACRDRDSAKKV